jgi:ribosomal protein S18
MLPPIIYESANGVNMARRRMPRQFPPAGLYDVAILARLLRFVKENGKITPHRIRNFGDLRHHDTVRRYIQFCIETKLIALDKAEAWGGRAGFRRLYMIRPEGEQFLALFGGGLPESKQEQPQQLT